MLPILISESLAPVSYFFCATAPPADASTSAVASNIAGERRLLMMGIRKLPIPHDSAGRDRSRSALPVIFSVLTARASRLALRRQSGRLEPTAGAGLRRYSVNRRQTAPSTLE